MVDPERPMPPERPAVSRPNVELPERPAVSDGSITFGGTEPPIVERRYLTGEQRDLLADMIAKPDRRHNGDHVSPYAKTLADSSLITNERGMWVVTEKGREALRHGWYPAG